MKQMQVVIWGWHLPISQLSPRSVSRRVKGRTWLGVTRPPGIQIPQTSSDCFECDVTPFDNRHATFPYNMMHAEWKSPRNDHAIDKWSNWRPSWAENAERIR